MGATTSGEEETNQRDPQGTRPQPRSPAALSWGRVGGPGSAFLTTWRRHAGEKHGG